MAKSKKAKSAADGSRLDVVTDYRFPDATRKNNPPAKIAAEGNVPLLPKAGTCIVRAVLPNSGSIRPGMLTIYLSY
jgi:hypothetical protein